MSEPEGGWWSHPLMRFVSNAGSSRSYYGLIRALETGELIIPEWQRGRVWSEQQKSDWCGYVLGQFPVPAVWMRQVDTVDGFRDELLDGQQRLTALLQWVRGEIPANLPWVSRQVWCTSEYDRRRLTRLATPCLELPTTTTDEQAVQLYLLLNTAGTPHTEQELDRARNFLRNKDIDND
jgi:hypothetical protein